MVIKRSIKILALIVGLVLAAIIFIGWLDMRANPDRVAFMLNIPSLPESVKVSDCHSPFVATDLLLMCSLTVDQEDFPSLLEGFDYQKTVIAGTSHSLTKESLGPDFIVEFQFVANPKRFEHGGQVILLVDKKMNHLLIDYYEE